MDYSVGNVTFARRLSDLSFLLIGKLNHVLIAKAVHVVGLNNCLENWEAMLDVSEVVVSIDVDSMNLDLVAWASDINQIMKHEDFFLARNTARWNCAWCLLNRQLLIVAIERLDLINLVGTTLVAYNTLSQTRFRLLRVCVHNRSLEISTLAAEVHLIVLWEDLCALGDDSSEFNQSIQVNLAQLTHFILHGQLIDPHIDLLV